MRIGGIEKNGIGRIGGIVFRCFGAKRKAFSNLSKNGISAVFGRASI